MNTFRKFTGHLKTVVTHKHYVFIHCVKAGIIWQGLVHDLSKFSPCEFIPGVRFFQGDKSPNIGERAEYGYSLAWMHHKGRNRHHFEYWNDLSLTLKRYAPVKMPLKYVKEMFCDRVAASKIYQGKNYTDAHPLEYFSRAKDHIMIHPKTAELLESWLVMLKEKGEKETFAHIRKLK